MYVNVHGSALPVNTRRKFLQTASSLGLGATLPATAANTRFKSSSVADGEQTKRLSLNGLWQFRLDPDKVGQTNGWYKPNQSSDAWQAVIVPHTWQIAEDSAEYFGTVWYRHLLEVPKDWSNQTVRIEVEGVSIRRRCGSTAAKSVSTCAKGTRPLILT